MLFRSRDLYKLAAEEQNTIEDQLKKMQIKLAGMAFGSQVLGSTPFRVFFSHLSCIEQSHYAAFYAWEFLKRKEYENVDWILSGIVQNRSEKEKNRNWIPLFDAKVRAAPKLLNVPSLMSTLAAISLQDGARS